MMLKGDVGCLLLVSAGARMRPHDCPVDVRRDAFEDLGVVAGLHVAEEGVD